MVRILMVVLVALIVVSCGQAPSPLNNATWELVAVNGNVIKEPNMPILRFGEGNLEGKGFCNSYAAEYQVNGDALTIAPIVATEMACEDAVFNILEREYLTTLNGVTRYGIDGDTLQLFDANGAVIVLFRKST
jgi:heat shock protein HslJ